jgi:hypothetical protein
VKARLRRDVLILLALICGAASALMASVSSAENSSAENKPNELPQNERKRT